MKRISIILSILLLCGLGAGSAHAQKSERGVAKIGKGAPVVAAKGTWMFGGTLNASGHLGNNFTLAVIDGINTNGYSISVKPTVMYLIADNFGVGMKGTYKRGLFELDQAKVELGDTKLEVKDLGSLKQSFGASVFGRVFVPLGNSQRFSIIGDLVLGADGGNSKLSKRKDGKIVGTYETNWSVNLNVDFGLMAFFTKNFAMEAELGILGAGFTGSKSLKNQVYPSSYNHANAYFSVNFLSLSVGAYLYF